MANIREVEIGQVLVHELKAGGIVEYEWVGGSAGVQLNILAAPHLLHITEQHQPEIPSSTVNGVSLREQLHNGRPRFAPSVVRASAAIARLR